MRRSDCLEHRGHAHQRSTEQTCHAYLGRCLELGPAEPDVDALGQRWFDPMCERPQHRGIRRAHVSESTGKRGSGVRPGERRGAREVDVVADDDRPAEWPVDVQDAGGIGEDGGAATCGPRGAHPVRDGLGVVSLVEVNAPESEEHRQPVDLQRAEGSTVASGGRRRETGQVGHGNIDPAGEQFGDVCPTRAEHHEQVVTLPSGPLGKDCGSAASKLKRVGNRKSAGHGGCSGLDGILSCKR